MLLLEAHQGSFLRDVSFLQVLPELLDLSFPLLVEFNLGMSGTPSFIEPLTQALQFSSQVRSLAFSLGSGLSLSLQLFFKLFNTSLDLLDGLLGLGDNRLLIIQFVGESSEVLFFPANVVFKVLLGPF